MESVCGEVIGRGVFGAAGGLGGGGGVGVAGGGGVRVAGRGL